MNKDNTVSKLKIKREQLLAEKVKLKTAGISKHYYDATILDLELKLEDVKDQLSKKIE